MNHSSSIVRCVLGTLVACLALLDGAAAHAQSCDASTDCLKGFTCEVVGGSACAGFACPDGQPCPPPPPCEPIDIKECRPGPCAADADCADGMVCQSTTYVDCPPSTQIDCPPGAACKAPAPQPCVEKTDHSCVPRYVPPCKVAADCGDGFSCVEQVVGECSGGGATPPAPTPGDPKAPVPLPPTPIDPVCTSKPTGIFYCEAELIDCAQDSDCPAQWTCAENPSVPVCAGPSTEPAPPPRLPGDPAAMPCGGAVPAICRVCSDGSCGVPLCINGAWEFYCKSDGGAAGAGSPPPPDGCGAPSPAPGRLCQPPFSDLGFGPGGIGTASSGGGFTGSGAPTLEVGARADGNSLTPSPTPSASPTSADGTPNTADGSMVKHATACSVTSPGAARGVGACAGLFGFLGLALLRPRRRIG